jgi:hypothetical protein
MMAVFMGSPSNTRSIHHQARTSDHFRPPVEPFDYCLGKVAFASVTTDWMMRSVIGVERVCRKEIGGTGPPAASSGAARAVRDLGLWQSGAAVLSGTRANTLASRIKTLGVQRK